MICGLPGAGKTTLAKKLEKERHAVRLCADEWIIGVLKDKSDIAEADRLRDPVEQMLWRLAQKLVLLGTNAILENGFWTATGRKIYVDKARELGVGIELHFLEASYDKLLERLVKRNANLPQGDFEIDLKKLKEWHKVFEPPTNEEAKAFDFFKKYE